MLNYKSFLQHVEQNIRSRFDDRYTISVQNFMRNNNTTLDGLVIFQSGCNISPTIYLNPYFHRYLNGVPLSDICDDIYDTYQMHATNNSFDTDWLEDAVAVRDHIVMRLVNYDHNVEFLKQVPHIRFKDLAIIFAVSVEHADIGEGSVVIQNSHMKLWNLTEEALYEAAIDNTPLIHPYAFTTIMESIIDLCNFGEQLDLDDIEDAEECPMYVLTNQDKHYGAAVIFYPDILEQIADKLDSDLVLIPSSIHEWIILPSCDATNLDAVTQMIRDVNDTELTDEEILADHPYYYSRSEQMIYTDTELKECPEVFSN